MKEYIILYDLVYINLYQAPLWSSCIPRIVSQRVGQHPRDRILVISGPRQLAATSRRVRSTRPLHRPGALPTVATQPYHSPSLRWRKNARAERGPHWPRCPLCVRAACDLWHRTRDESLPEGARAVDDLPLRALLF